MILQCFQIAFKKVVRFDKYTLGIVLIDVSLYILLNMRLIPSICAIALYVMLFIYCYIEYKQTILKTIAGFTIGFVLVGGIESVLAFCSNLYKNASNSYYILILLNVIALCVAYIIKKYVIRTQTERVISYNWDVWAVIVLSDLSIVLLLIDYYCVQKLVNIYIVCTYLFLIVILFFLYRLEMARNEINKKNYQIELQRIYGSAYEELISEVRRRQHDYKNQLSAIYSMHLVANSLDELICMQNNYGDIIRCDSKFDSILTSCNNSILAGYLYHRCVVCEKNGFLVNYNINIDQAICSFQLHEIIEVLGILIDNACENFTEIQTGHKIIKIECLEKTEDIILCVSNPSEYIAYSDIENMFIEGFSTKGEQRGIGLARVLKLTQKYNAELKVTNMKYDEQNWIEFYIRIKK
jgi:hypothetical protein